MQALVDHPLPPTSSQTQPEGDVPTPDSTQLPACRHCGAEYVQGHGSFPVKDGTRRPRYLCCICNRTFSVYTGTPKHYIKKGAEWDRQAAGLGQGLPVRKMAALLGVCASTVFSWRHRILDALSLHPQQPLDGSVALGETYVRYSEKGTRTPVNRLRRFVDQKPSCVLLASADEARAALVAGRGRLTPDELKACLERFLEKRADVFACGLAPYADACRLMGVTCQDALIQGVSAPFSCVEMMRRQLHGWLGHFCGVATKYLGNYVTWLSHISWVERRKPADAGREMLAAAMVPARPREMAA